MKGLTFSLNKSKNIKGILIGIFVSEIILTVLLSILAMIMSSSGILDDTILEIALTFICGVCTFFGSFVCSKIIGEKGLVNGIICSVIFFLILMFSGVIITESNFTSFSVFKIVASVVFGIIGGILGVSKKDKLIK